jgi:NADH-quinone oxidoreductase subunit C
VAEALIELVQARLAPALAAASEAHGVLVLELPAAELAGAVACLKSEFAFDMLLDVTAVDWPGEAKRFEVVYHLYSTSRHVRVRIKTRVAEADPSVDTLTALYGAARYMERECHEMYGIAFRGNADLRPALLYEGFEGHPLRKDYPKLHEQPLVDYRK